MTISTFNLSKNEWLLELKTPKTTYRAFEKVCSIRTIIFFIARALIQESKFRMRGL